MDAAATNPDGKAKSAVAEPGARTSGPDGRQASAFTEVREGMARFRAGQVARLAIRDDADRRIRERQHAAFCNPWADFADRHDRPVQKAMIRFQPLLLLVGSLATTVALLMLLGVFGTALTVAPGAE